MTSEASSTPRTRTAPGECGRVAALVALLGALCCSGARGCRCTAQPVLPTPWTRAVTREQGCQGAGGGAGARYPCCHVSERKGGRRIERARAVTTPGPWPVPGRRGVAAPWSCWRPPFLLLCMVRLPVRRRAEPEWCLDAGSSKVCLHAPAWCGCVWRMRLRRCCWACCHTATCCHG